MTPTLIGRMQTRAALILTVGVIWTVLIVPALPRSGMAGIGAVYRVAFFALAATIVVGIVLWEPLYHLAQQWRWEKDWPISYGLLQGIPEGILVYFITDAAVGPVPVSTFAPHFITTWIVVWLVANGPMRVILLRWRYRGGRVL